MKQLKNRNRVISGIYILITLIFIIKLFYIQVLNKKYKFSANNNVLRYDVLQPIRGLVYDRDSTLIVINEPAYDLMIIPREVVQMDTLSFCKLIDISKIDFRKKIKAAKKYSKFKESVFVKQINYLDAADLQEKLYQFPGFFLRTITMRKYPFNTGSHVIGYMGEVNTKKTKEDKYYTKGDLAGVSGIEAAYEEYLRGKKGMAIKLVDVHNRAQGKFNDGVYDSLPIQGKNIQVTIDINLQNYGEKLMKNKIGAIVALEPSTGEILSLVSSPNYNPNDLTGRKRSSNFNALLSDDNKPLFNRALLGEYPPGSTFKLLNGLIALQSGRINHRSTFNCNNGYSYENDKKVSCHPHSTPVNLNTAVSISCNSYFCHIFEAYFKKFENTKNAYNSWYNHIRSFGIGEWMNNDFISGRRGFLPESNYYDNYYSKNHWNSSTIISMAIGQGEILLTPIQLANMVTIIANRGFYYTPHIIKSIEGEDSIDSSYTNKKFCTIDEEHFTSIIEGMYQVVESDNGTAKETSIENIQVCGKTGTAQNPHGEDHSIYIAFAPKNNPQIALAVYVENGGWGSTWAAPIASLMIEKYINGKISNLNLSKEDYIENASLLKQ